MAQEAIRLKHLSCRRRPSRSAPGLSLKATLTRSPLRRRSGKMLQSALHTPPPKLSRNTCDAGPSPSPSQRKFSVPQVQPAVPPRKCSSGAPLIVQADAFFNCDSHAFNNHRSAEDRAERGSRTSLRNAIAKAHSASPHLPCCAILRLCLVSGNIVEQSTMQLSPFLLTT